MFNCFPSSSTWCIWAITFSKIYFAWKKKVSTIVEYLFIYFHKSNSCVLVPVITVYLFRFHWVHYACKLVGGINHSNTRHTVACFLQANGRQAARVSESKDHGESKALREDVYISISFIRWTPLDTFPRPPGQMCKGICANIWHRLMRHWIRELFVGYSVELLQLWMSTASREEYVWYSGMFRQREN